MDFNKGKTYKFLSHTPDSDQFSLIYIWATSQQNQQNDCAPIKDSD